MFSRAIAFALLSLAISAQALPNSQSNSLKGQSNNLKGQCSSVSTVVRTVTVSARAGAATAAAGVTKTTKAVAATATKASSNNNNNNNNVKTASAAGSKSTSTAATGNNANGNPQTSLTLDPRVIASGFANNGQDVPTAGQVASLTSTNNFINFCLNFPNLQITNGKQIQEGSCNPAPIGVIPSVDNMPSSKFSFPSNFGTIKAGQTFDIVMNIQNMQTGFFVNAQESYFSAPQQLNSAGQIQGHSHVVVEQLSSLSQTTPTDPKKFAFFKGLNGAAVNGKLSATVTNGLTPGFYKLSSINSAANHQPVIVPVAQHGSLDDAIYFTVTADGKASTGGNNVSGTTPASSSAAVKATSTKAAASTKATSTKGRGSKRALNRL